MNIRDWIVDLAVALGKDIGPDRLKLYERDLMKITFSDREWDLLSERIRDHFDQFFPTIAEIRAMAKVIFLERKYTRQWETWTDERGHCWAKPVMGYKAEDAPCTVEEGMAVSLDVISRMGISVDSPFFQAIVDLAKKNAVDPKKIDAMVAAAKREPAEEDYEDVCVPF